MSANITTVNGQCRVTIDVGARPMPYTFTLTGVNVWGVQQLRDVLLARKKTGINVYPVRFGQCKVGIVGNSADAGGIAKLANSLKALPVDEIVADLGIIDSTPASESKPAVKATAKV